MSSSNFLIKRRGNVVAALVKQHDAASLAEALLEKKAENLELQEQLRCVLTAKRHLELELSSSRHATYHHQQQQPRSRPSSASPPQRTPPQQVPASMLPPQDGAGQQGSPAQPSLDAAVAGHCSQVLQQVRRLVVAHHSSSTRQGGSVLRQRLLQLLDAFEQPAVMPSPEGVSPVCSLQVCCNAHKVLMQQALLLQERMAAPAAQLAHGSSGEQASQQQLAQLLRSHVWDMHGLLAATSLASSSSSSSSTAAPCSAATAHDSSRGRARSPAAGGAAAGARIDAAQHQHNKNFTMYLDFPLKPPLSARQQRQQAAEAAWAAAEVARLQQAVLQQEHTLQAQSQQLQHALHQLDAAHQAATAAQGQAEQASTLAAQRQAELCGLRAQLAESMDAQAQLRRQLSETQQQRDAAARDRDTATQQAQQLQQALAQTAQQLRQLQQQDTELQHAQAQLQQQLSDTQRQRDAAVRECDAAKQQVQQLQAAQAHAAQAHDALQQHTAAAELCWQSRQQALLAALGQARCAMQDAGQQQDGEGSDDGPARTTADTEVLTEQLEQTATCVETALEGLQHVCRRTSAVGLTMPPAAAPTE